MKTDHIAVSLYIHTPWCLHKCPYCDFNSHALKDIPPEKAYVKKLIRDFNSQLSQLQTRKIQTIFIGGGTPSLFTAHSYDQLFRALKQQAEFSDNIEITIEANPGTFEQDRFAAYRAIGINRLSLGVQSFQNDKLKKLQRIHDADEAIHAAQKAKRVGFDNINIDLMFGLPDQSIADGLYDLQTAIDLNPNHISWYQLTIEPHTYFYQHQPILPNEEIIWQLQLAGQQLLQQNGYQHYEVSAFSKLGYQCQHNRNYWQYGDYIGIGAGAHGKITEFQSQQIIRRWNHKNPKDYLNPDKPALNDSKIVTAEERPLEFMMNALRLHEAILFSLFEQRTGLDIEYIQKSLNKAQQQSLLTSNKHQIQVTDRGYRYLNELLMLF